MRRNLPTNSKGSGVPPHGRLVDVLKGHIQGRKVGLIIHHKLVPHFPFGSCHGHCRARQHCTLQPGVACGLADICCWGVSLPLLFSLSRALSHSHFALSPPPRSRARSLARSRPLSLSLSRYQSEGRSNTRDPRDVSRVRGQGFWCRVQGQGLRI